MVVGCAQRAHVAPAQLAGIGEAAASPAEGRAAKPPDQKIGHQARVPPVAVWKWMNDDQPVMETQRDFIGWIGRVVHPA